MPGGLIQLTVTGKQNKVLTGQPEMTYFKYAYKQHTNFACESIAQTFDGKVDFGNKISSKITRNGDLVTNMTLEITLPDVRSMTDSVNSDGSTTIVNWVNAIGHRIIENISIEIGGQFIDRHTGEWLELNSELTMKEGQKQAYYKMVKKEEFYYIRDVDQQVVVYIPFQFWFCRETGLALPLVALQYHDVKVNISLRKLNECINYHDRKVDGTYRATLPEYVPRPDLGRISITNARLLCDYVYLDVCERKWYAQHSHKYLIEQIQYNGSEGVITSSDYKQFLDFNHACKELIWYLERTDKTHPNDWLNFSRIDNTDKYSWGSPSNADIMKSMKLYLNGIERVEERSADYFRLVNSFSYHTRNPNNYIYSYSFALHPEKINPSGALNFSQIDEVFLHLKNHSNFNYTLHTYAKNYNMLVITQGMGGLVFNV